MSPVRRMFEHQLGHLVALALLVAALLFASRIDGFASGEFLGIHTTNWVWLCVANAVVHQVWVWFCWRAELHAGLLSRHLGKAAFPVYAVVFAVLILARPVLMTALGYANRGTLPLDRTVATILAVLCALPGLYLLYSLKRYFGLRRAFGIDHFDPSYRSAPLVRQGIFRYSSNAMYLFGFLLLWIPAFAFCSTAALGVALFSHLYIWVHYRFTEKPDMDRIYQKT